ncbi:MAG TPA: hypothetical protein VGJ22_01970 [Anaerolineales bacterium]|jgi:hypothetical protein
MTARERCCLIGEQMPPESRVAGDENIAIVWPRITQRNARNISCVWSGVKNAAARNR